jgi:glycosyltransferase involved in cell wall biosynthesis
MDFLSMHILQIVPHYVPAHRFGGPQRVAHSLGKALVRAGNNVVVCTTNLASRKEDLATNLDQPVEVDGVTVYYEPTQWSRYWGFSPALWRRVKKEMQTADVAFVHAHYQFANWAGARLAREAHVPYVVFAHGSLHQGGIAHQKSLLKKLYLRILEERNFHNALFLAFNAAEEKTYSLYQNLGKVVPSGIDPLEFLPLPPLGAFRERYPELRAKTLFLFLGRLDIRHKGLDMLLPAFANLLKERPDAHLVLAGPEEDGSLAQLQHLLVQHQLHAAVTFTGLLTGAQKLAALQDADVFVLPSRFEGLSIALLEALYMGLPLLITSQVGLCQEIQQIGAGVVVEPQVEGISLGLCTLGDPETRARLRGRGRNLILQQYTWDAIALNFMGELKEHIL